MIKVALIVTVLNEERSIDALLSGMLAQQRLPDEIIIVDGGSSDRTWERLLVWQQQSSIPLHILRSPGSNIAAGRNQAIRASQSDIIAVTDAGVRLPEEWLQRLITPLNQPDPPDVACGFFAADPQTLFERVLGAITLPRENEIKSGRFMPSSRSVAFRHSAWEAVGGYPEWLDYCEDLVFDFALQDAGYRFQFVPDALVWFRPRPNPRSFYRQYYRYSRGDGKAGLYVWRHLLRYAIYLLMLASVLAALLAHPIFWAVTALALAAILGRALRRMLPELRRMQWQSALRALLWWPVIVLTGDAAKMLGYPVGAVWRAQNAPHTQWSKRTY